MNNAVKKLASEIPMNCDAVAVAVFMSRKTEEGESLSVDKILSQISLGKQRLMKAMKYLEDKGYLKRRKIKNRQGRFSGIVYELA